MPNTPVPAAGEAMPGAEEMIIGRFSRRRILAGIAAIPAMGVATEAPAASNTMADPLADTIAEYYAKMAEFMALPVDQVTIETEEALVAATYGPANERLWHATPPAISLRGVAEAIRHALKQDVVLDITCENSLRSALAFLEREHGL
ncbi:hypothetical protein [Mesorhizobium sp. WSM4313]|uniref:hypothetical protein n=1 Tax=Mesorhizobium sp. WSM4313 TaxID=2029412 RepID=UPI000BCE28A3|nr:hypothetical protein [Mesorhizobium sp. WSM4313]PBB20541.1 hypothetical protein CK219_05220 [Mesorhizobium sp. WSM4313]